MIGAQTMLDDTEARALARALIEKLKSEKGIAMTEAGYYVFWPTRLRGYFCAAELRVIADEIDKMNADWDAEVNDYFDSQRPAS